MGDAGGGRRAAEVPRSRQEGRTLEQVEVGLLWGHRWACKRGEGAVRAQVQVGGCAWRQEPLEGLFFLLLFSQGHQVTVALETVCWAWGEQVQELLGQEDEGTRKSQHSCCAFI